MSVCCGGGDHGQSNNPEKGANTGGISSGTIVDKPIIPPQKHHSGCGFHNKDGVGFKITGNTDESEFGEVNLFHEDAYIGIIVKYNKNFDSFHIWLLF